MILLAANSLIAPAVGMIFWALVIFLLTWLVIGRFTFKPIAKALREREQSIGSALAEAERARAEMARIAAANEAALKAQHEERNLMIKEAKEMKDQIVREARESAKVETARIIAEAHRDIEAQKAAAMLEVKNAAGQLAIDVAQKVLQNQLTDPSAQLRYADTLIDEINFN